MKRRQALKVSSLATIGLTATINGGCSKNTVLFNHGVASGDPLSDRVILWTRVTPKKPGPVEVNLEISVNRNFSQVLFSKALKKGFIPLNFNVLFPFQMNSFCSSENFFCASVIIGFFQI